MTVVNRSSWSSTGTPTTVARAATSALAALRRRSVVTRQAARQADDDELGLLVAAPARRCVGGRPARAPARQHRQRRGDRARPVADGDADALRPEVETERPHSTRTPARPPLAMRSASSRPAGSLPPAVATSPLPPPPPPTALAASRMRVAASMPEPGRTAATRLTPPDGDSPPSTTMSAPGWLRTATASSRRSLGARPSTRCTTMPSTAAAASSAAWPVASLARSTLSSSFSARISSSLRWTPPRTSSAARRAAWRRRRSSARRAGAGRRWLRR